jgi:hypothetical protein
MSTSPKTTTAKTAPKTAPEPPAAALDLDAHWAAKQAKLRNRKTTTATLRICDDDDLKATLEEAKRARRVAAADLETQQTKDGKEQATRRLEAADEALQAAQAAVDAATVTLTFRGLPRKAYEALVNEHPPTEEEAEEGGEWNAETFTPALVAASSVDGMPIEDAAYFLEEWSPAEAGMLFNAAMSVQLTSRMDLGKG